MSIPEDPNSTSAETSSSLPPAPPAPLVNTKISRDAQLSKYIESAHEFLLKNPPTVSIPERVFVEGFLRFFAGHEPENGHKVGLWAGIAGNPMCSVNVLGGDGAVLYTVPPLFDRSTINPKLKPDGHKSIWDIVETMEVLGRHHPQHGEAYWDHQMSQKALTLRVPQNVLRDLATWNAIFKRYGMTEIASLPDGMQVPGQTQNNNQPPPALEYDVLE